MKHEKRKENSRDTSRRTKRVGLPERRLVVRRLHRRNRMVGERRMMHKIKWIRNLTDVELEILFEEWEGYFRAEEVDA